VAAVLAGAAQVVEAAEVAALALPVADRVVDEIELGDARKSVMGKTELNTACKPQSSRSEGSRFICRKRS